MELANAGQDQPAKKSSTTMSEKLNLAAAPSAADCRKFCGSSQPELLHGHSCAYSQRHDQYIPELQRSGQPIDDVGSRLEPKDQFSKLLASFLVNSRCCVMYSWTTCRASIICGSISPRCALASGFWSEAGASCCRMVEPGSGLQLARLCRRLKVRL
jgi:hypothetical protein